MAERDPDDGELERRIAEAEKDIGPENLAKFRSLPPEIQSALLSKALEPKARRRSGGRPKGSGGDHYEALRKMACLLVDNPEMKVRAAARQIAKEANVSWEHLRRLYGQRREVLEAEELARRKKPPAAPPIIPPAPQPWQPVYGLPAGDYMTVAEAARRINEELERVTAAGATQRDIFTERISDLAAAAGIGDLSIAALTAKMTVTSIAEQIAAGSVLSGLEDAIRTASKRTTDLLHDLLKESQVGQKVTGEFLTQSDWVRNQILTQLGGSKTPPEK